jgi:hypothetical protein
MRGRLYISAAVIFVSVVAVRADVAFVGCSESAELTCSISLQPTPIRPQAVRTETSSRNSRISPDVWSDGLFRPVPSHHFSQPKADTQVNLLPAGPSSVSLFLAAFGSLGVWRLGRSVRKFQFGCAPDWYHTGGPIQVGHAKAMEFDFTQSVISSLDEPTDEHHLSFRMRRRNTLRCRKHPYLRILRPRGPPTRSLLG